MAGPLKGIRIIDLSSTLMGPYASQFLGDLGAEVIKVEPPKGDVVRDVGASKNKGMGALFLNNNRSKKSIQIDLKSEAGREVLLRLIKQVDVLMYNMRPQAMDRLDLSYEILSDLNPRLIYAGMHGFGAHGPYSERPAYDDLIQAGSGLAHLFSYRDPQQQPAYVPNAISDRVGALTAVIAILSALWERTISGKGQKLQIPMFESMAHFVLCDHLDGLSFVPPLNEGGYTRQLSAYRKPYQTRDGFIGVLFYTDAHWERFFEAIDRADDFSSDPRYATMESRQEHIDEIYAELESIFAQRSNQEWMELLIEADVPAMPLHDFQGLLNDPHLQAVGFFEQQEHPTEGTLRTMKVPMIFSRTQPKPTHLAPNLGADTAQVLKEFGLTEAELQSLAAQGVINTN